MYPDQYLVGHDLSRLQANSLEDCLYRCSLYQSGLQKPPCETVSFASNNNTCFLKDGNATTSALSARVGIISAIAQAGQFTPSSLACGFNQNQIYNTSNGMQFEVNCYRDAPCCDPDATTNSYYGWHGNSLSDCVELCSHMSPLCYGVVWDADLLNGWHNCYAKLSNISNKITTSPLSVAHVAQVILPVDSSCQDGNYTSKGRVFTKSCDNNVDGNSIGQVHTANLEDCVDYCATFQNGTQSCVSVAYQPGAADGFENCYLKSDLSTPYSQYGWHAATFEGNSTSTSPAAAPSSSASSHPSSTPSNPAKNPSHAWIAGAVVGPIIVIALLIIGIILWRRRGRRTSSDLTTSSNEKPEMGFERSRYEVHGKSWHPSELGERNRTPELAG